jgi:general secretion pathway protein G
MRKRRQDGFTLLEIMLVVTIISVLLGVAIYKFKGNVEFSQHVAVTSDIRGISTQLKLYQSLNGFMPSTQQGLQALVTQPSTEPAPQRWMQFFDSVPKDPWHNDYIYRCPGLRNPNGYDLFSAGPDRKPDTADDDWGD